MSESGVGRTLKPSKVNQFGQVNNAEQDATSGYAPSGHESALQHKQSDVDSGPKSQHHTLGKGRNQASPGNHIHDGASSPKIGPMQMDPSSTGQTRPEWTLPTSPTVNDLVQLLSKFVNFRQV